MPVRSVVKDLDQRTLTVTAELAAPVERVWDLSADPRRLERHWGPPGWPATFVRHELVPGTRSHYFMTGPAGERADGVWDVVAVDPPVSFEVRDAFADHDGVPDESIGWARMAVSLEPAGAGTLVRMVSTFASAEQLHQMVETGMEEGLRLAMGQIDALLVEEPGA